MQAPTTESPIYIPNGVFEDMATGLARYLLDFHCPKTEAIYRLGAANVWPVSIMDDAEEA